MRTLLCLGVAAVACAAPVSAQHSVLFFSRYDSTSIDDKSGRLSQLRPFGITAVTPGKGATAHVWVPAAGISAQVGDADNDGRFAEFNGLPQARWGLGAPFVKHADKKSGDPRRVYWTIRESQTSPPTVTLFTPSGTHTVRVGDWVRVLDNGDVEFFIKQEHIVKAQGPQSGNWVNGATCICQTQAGDIYYAPAHAISKNGNVAGGHWVSNGSKQVFAFDGAICYIPAKDITYDANGNVQDVKAGSGRLVVNEIGTGPNGEISVRDMCKNSGAVDRIGNNTTITFMMVGMDVDPNGGTFTGWFDKQVKHPNLVFVFENTDSSCCNQSWMSTIFTTAGTPMGQIAKINGMQMGATSGNADGSWIGIKAGSGAQSAPVIRGLTLIEGGLKPTAPYNSASLQTDNDGLVTLSQDPTVRLSAQGAMTNFPTAVFVGLGPSKGGRQKGTDFSSIFGGFATVHILNGTAFAGQGGAADPKSQSTYSFSVGNNPSLIGKTVIFQSASLTPSLLLLSNPLLIEFR